MGASGVRAFARENDYRRLLPRRERPSAAPAIPTSTKLSAGVPAMAARAPDFRFSGHTFSPEFIARVSNPSDLPSSRHGYRRRPFYCRAGLCLLLAYPSDRTPPPFSLVARLFCVALPPSGVTLADRIGPVRLLANVGQRLRLPRRFGYVSAWPGSRPLQRLCTSSGEWWAASLGQEKTPFVGRTLTCLQFAPTKGVLEHISTF